MAARIDGGLKQRREDVLQHLLKVGQLFLGMVHITDETEGKHVRLAFPWIKNIMLI